MRWPRAWKLILWLSIGLIPSVGTGQTAAIRQEQDPWGRFRPGAWKLVEVTNETFEGQGSLLRSITQVRTTLTRVASDGVTLLTEVTINVGGKKFDPEPQTVKQGLMGWAPSGDAKVTELPAGELTIRGCKIPCRIRQLERAGPSGSTVTTIHYSDSVAPYVLKRHTKTIDAEGKPVSETTMEVLDLDAPCFLFGVFRESAHLKTSYKHANGTTTTLAVVSADVPGGLIWQDRREMDAEGRPVARVTLRLTGYGLEPEKEKEKRGGLFSGRRRARKAARR